MNTNKKILEGQHEAIVSEKFNMEQQLEQLKHKNESQKLQIIELQREIDSFNENGNKIADKFNLLKEQEKVHDTVVGALTRKFEEEVTEFLSDDSSGNCDHQSPVSVAPVDYKNNQIPSTPASSNISQIGTGLVAGVTNNQSEQNITEEVEPQLMENIAGINNEHFLKDERQFKTLALLLQIVTNIVPRNRVKELG